MKNNKLDDEFIKIINAKVTNKELIDYILYLEKAKILNKIEINFCDLIIEQLEMFNTIDYKQICQNLKITNYQELQFYDGNELPNKIDEFIKNRKKIAREKIFKDVKENGIKATTKSLTQLFFERYSRMIDIKEDNETFKKLENISKDAYDKNDYSISSAIQLVDNLTNGLKGGTITSIIGGNNDVKSLWAINIAYKNLLQNKNVLYIAIKYLK